jgi:hypothetical protein
VFHNGGGHPEDAGAFVRLEAVDAEKSSLGRVPMLSLDPAGMPREEK